MLGGVAFLEKQQLPRGQLGGRLKEAARGKRLHLKRFEPIFIDILTKPQGFIGEEEGLGVEPEGKSTSLVSILMSQK